MVGFGMVAEVVTDVAPAQGADLKAAAAGAGKLARPEKPDRSKYEKQVETLKDQVSKCLDTMGELSKKIDKLKEARKGKEGPMAEPRAKLIEYRTQLKAIYVSGSQTICIERQGGPPNPRARSARVLHTHPPVDFAISRDFRDANFPPHSSFQLPLHPG